MNKGFKYRIYPTKTQQKQIKIMFNGKRFIWNYFLALNKERLKNNERIYTFYQMSSLLTQLKKEQEWLKQCEKSILQNTLKNLYKAFQDYFKKAKGFPKFKSYKNNHHSVKMNITHNNIEILEKNTQYTSTCKYKKQNCKIKLPKIKKVKIAYSRQYEGRILSATISQVPSGKYFVSLCCTDVENNKFNKTDNTIGIDLGIKEFAIFNTGEKINNPKYYKKYEQKLKKNQRKLSSKQKGSKNKNKQRIKVARIHKKIYNTRLDFLHKLSTRLVKENDIICIEDLKVNKMLHDKKNKKLHKSISDASFYEFKRQLQYKILWNDKILSIINQYFPSSKLCSDCGFKYDDLTLDIREWQCKNCGSIHDRDVNAAINILNEGLRLLVS